MRDDDQHTQDQYDDHMRRIDDIKRQFARGQIGVKQKRRYIAEENMAYYREENYRSTANNERICQPPRVRNEITGIVADATGVDYEVARIALDRRRELSLAASYADTRAETVQLLADSRDAFYDILAAAGGQHARKDHL